MSGTVSKKGGPLPRHRIFYKTFLNKLVVRKRHSCNKKGKPKSPYKIFCLELF